MSRTPAVALLRRVRVGRWRPESCLVVPVPAASGLIRRSRSDPPGSVAGLPPHVTLLYPFLPPATIDHSVASTVVEVAARFPSFTFRLARVGRFPGVVYVEPEPAHPFVALMDALLDRWPHHPPYGGRYTEFVPHVTVLAAAPEPPGLLSALEEALPVECRADRLHLLAQDHRGRWRVEREALLGAGEPARR